ADLLSKQDRAYQIAAAHFYAQQLEAARQEFEAIAGDDASPWKQIAQYIAVRSMVRQATLAKELNKDLLRTAQEKLKQLMTNPAYSSLRADLESLSSYIAARITPEEHLTELAAAIGTQISSDNAGEFTKTLDLILGDDGNDEGQQDYGKLPASVK